MSVRKRIWKTKGVEKSAWVVDYVDHIGSRRNKTFNRRSDAVAFASKVKARQEQPQQVKFQVSVRYRKGNWYPLHDKYNIEAASVSEAEQWALRKFAEFTDVEVISVSAIASDSAIRSAAVVHNAAIEESAKFCELHAHVPGDQLATGLRAQLKR
jgi:hypothetical protein